MPLPIFLKRKILHFGKGCPRSGEECFYENVTEKRIDTKLLFSRFKRKKATFFVIFSENMLDNLEYPCYIIQARVRNKYARTAMKREIAS